MTGLLAAFLLGVVKWMTALGAKASSMREGNARSSSRGM
jgi:hypothetical protein